MFDDDEAQEREEEEYRQKVGLLQFAATLTRPDIAFSCRKLGSGLMVRSDQHWREVDRCLSYLAGTRDTTLEFGSGPESLKLVGYADDAATSRTGRARAATCSSTKGLPSLGRASASSARSCRRPCRSTWRPLRLARRDADFASFLQIQLLDAGTPTVLRVDKSAITVAEGLGLQGNLKHMERRYAWLQQMVKHGKFVLRYIPTTEQPDDFHTKALHFPAFDWCSVAIGHVRLADVGNGDDDVQQ
ncbi:unnamed protein product [Closterium sp. NIES-53]